MRLINTKVHAVLDFLLALVLVFAPWYFRFTASGPKYAVPLTVGIVAPCLALITKFEYAPFKLLPLRVHLAIDVLSGLFLAASPWIFEFSEVVYKPHVVFGLTHAVIGLLTDRMLYNNVRMITTRTDADGNIVREKENGEKKDKFHAR